MWLYQTQGLIIIFPPVPDVNWYFYNKEDISTGHKKKKKRFLRHSGLKLTKLKLSKSQIVTLF